MADNEKQPQKDGQEQSHTIGESMDVDFWTLLAESRIV